MTTFPGSPKLTTGGIVLLNPSTSAVQRIVSLQYNSDTLTRTWHWQCTRGDDSERSKALRLKGSPVKTIKLDAEIDAADQLEFLNKNNPGGE